MSLSIIIPTIGRTSIQATTDELAKQIHDARINAEILIGTSKLTVSSVLQGLNCRIIYTTSGTAAENRNICAYASQKELLLFLDDDCMPSAELLSSYLGAASSRPDVTAFAGMVNRIEGTSDEDRAWREAGFDRFFSLPRLFSFLRWAPTANFLVRRKTFLSLQGFSDLGIPVGGEDIDFGLRLCDAGLGPILSAPGADVTHLPIEGNFESLEKKAFYYGQSEQALAKLHPRYVTTSTESTKSLPAIELTKLLEQAWDRGRRSITTNPVIFSPTLAADILNNLDSRVGYVHGSITSQNGQSPITLLSQADRKALFDSNNRCFLDPTSTLVYRKCRDADLSREGSEHWTPLRALT